MTPQMTKSIQIARPAADAYAFIADPATLPRWAIHNVRSIRPLGNGRWEMETPHGKASLVPRYDPAGGILDHDYIDANEGLWSVSARVVAISASECVYVITLAKPPGMPLKAFVEGMRLMDAELAALKGCVEAREAAPEAAPAPATVQVVQRIYDAFARRDLATLFALLADDVEILQSTALPWGGTYRGHDGARQFFGKLGAHITSTLSLSRLVAAGDHVAACGRTRGAVNASGAAFDAAAVHLWKLRDGQVTQVLFLVDQPPMLAALAA